MDNGGLRYGAMESALRPPLPTATQALAELQIQPGLDQRLRAKHHRRDPRKQTPSGRHQIGIPAGFKSESVAGFLLECVAGFVGIRIMDKSTTYIGLDVHKDTVAVALAEAGVRSNVREYGEIANTPAAAQALATKLSRVGNALRFCYEAG